MRTVRLLAGAAALAAASVTVVAAPSVAGATVRPSAVVSTGSGLCLDVNRAGTANGTKVQLWECNGTPAQRWTLERDGEVKALGRCLDVNRAGTADGTRVQLWRCNGTKAQQWVKTEENSRGFLLRNPNSDKCLAPQSVGDGAGSGMVIRRCDPRDTAQRWELS